MYFCVTVLACTIPKVVNTVAQLLSQQIIQQRAAEKQLENLTLMEAETTTTGNLDGTIDGILTCKYDTSNSSSKDLDCLHPRYSWSVFQRGLEDDIRRG